MAAFMGARVQIPIARSTPPSWPLPGAGFTVDGRGRRATRPRIDAGAKLGLPERLAVRELNANFPIAGQSYAGRGGLKNGLCGTQAGMAISRNVRFQHPVLRRDVSVIIDPSRGQPRSQRQAVISSVAPRPRPSRLSMLDGGKFTFRQRRMLLVAQNTP